MSIASTSCSVPDEKSTSNLSSISDESLDDYEEGEIIREKTVSMLKSPVQTPRSAPLEFSRQSKPNKRTASIVYHSSRSSSPECSRQRKRHKKRTSKSRSRDNDDSSDEKQKKKHKSKKRLKSKTRHSTTDSTVSSPERNSKIEKELETYRELLNEKRNIYKKFPEGHPLYKSVRSDFHLKKPTGKDKYEMRDEWSKYWHKRMKKFDEDLIRARRSELNRKYSIMEVDERIAKSKSHEERNSDNKKRKRKSSDSSPPKPHYLALMTHSQLAGPSKKKSPCSVPSSAALLKTSPEKKEPVSASSNPPPQSTAQSIPLPPIPPPRPPPPPASSHSLLECCSAEKEAEPDSSPSLLQILTLLAALEDNLGSLGATVTVVLSRVLAVERQQPGMSSSLVQEAVDLIDTCKMKLIGHLEMELVQGARAKAVQSTVNKINRFLQTVEKPPSMPVVPIPIRLVPLIPSPPPLIPLSSEEQMFGQRVSFGCKATEPVVQEVPANSSTNLVSVPPTDSQCQQTKNDDNNNNSIKKDASAEVQQFTGDDLLMLIQNFALLEDVQKRQLIYYLRRLEGVWSTNGSVRNTSAELSRQIQPVHSTSSCGRSQRFPVIYSLTGLTASDLEKLGVPIDDISNRIPASHEERNQWNSVCIVDSSNLTYPKETNQAISSPSKLRVKTIKKDPRLNPLLRRSRNEQMKPYQ